MELTFNQDMFLEMNQDSLMDVDGGSISGVVGAIAVGAIGVIAGPPAFITGSVAVGAWYVGSVLIAGGGIVSAFGK